LHGSVDNNLAGKFPVEFAKFTGLKRIALPSNFVTGTIPSNIGELSELTLFEMDFNPGFGGFLPSSLFQLPLLTRLWMDECSILGSLPDTVGDAVQLTSLSMARSGLSGAIPTSLSQLTALQTIFLNQNKLTGTLPALNNSTILFRIVLFDNLFEGTIPDHYGQLVNLERLLIDQNALTGTIPDFSGSSVIRFLYLYENQLTGSIERVFTTTPTDFLVEVALDINQLTGSIPTNVGSFPQLDGLWLYQNDLTGTIPTEVRL
jgi:Leucine-rich repeat (LRR) protein